LNKQILVGTIFVNDSKVQKKWFNIQQQFLLQTTGDFDHLTVLHKGDPDYFSSRSNVIIPPNLGYGWGDAHQQGLEILVSYFLERKNDYEYFLILDSDAFPVRDNWLELLVSVMDDREVALPVRAESLELRLHASVLFAKPQALPHLKFESGYLGLNLIGEDEHDIHIPYYQHKAREKAFALMRSNKYNFHPVACGIYYDSFYHHCCGSRNFVMRSEKYWRHVGSFDYMWTADLMNNPQEFVRRLRNGL
jgi:hypothetical protein